MASVDTTPAQSTTAARPAMPKIAVENPTGRVVGPGVADLSAERVAELSARLGRAAQPGWWETGFDGPWAASCGGCRSGCWTTASASRGRSSRRPARPPRMPGKARDHLRSLGVRGFWAKHAGRYLADERVRSSSVLVKGKKLILRYEPLGLIGVIGPWNYPLVNSFGDAIPALAAGNSVILKPSEVTPLTSMLLAEGLVECGAPEHVFQVATGRGETGAALIDQVDMIMFTGSTATGRRVMERAAKTLTPVSLELGGKDPMIVLSDADLERAANLAVYYSMQNSGQTCISVERVYVEEPVYDEFVAKVTGKVRALRQGQSTGPGTVEVGAMTFPRQTEIVEDHVQDALSKGARALTGGHRREGAATTTSRRCSSTSITR